jgi:hypothetical protein
MSESRLGAFLTIFFSITINFFVLSFLVGAPWPNLFGSHEKDSLMSQKMPEQVREISDQTPIPKHLEKSAFHNNSVAHFTPAKAEKSEVKVTPAKKVYEANFKPNVDSTSSGHKQNEDSDETKEEKLVPVEDKIAGVQGSESDSATEAAAAEANPATPEPQEAKALDSESN